LAEPGSAVAVVGEQESLFAVEVGELTGRGDESDHGDSACHDTVATPVGSKDEVETLLDLDSAGPPAGAATTEPVVEVVRSARRRRTVSARRVGDRIIVSVPARLSKAEERRWVATMVERILAGEQRRRPSDRTLADRATLLSDRYLAGRAVPASVRWVDNMTSRWGSCTVADGTIRLSRRLEGMPEYVVDYVLLHELVHLLVPSHGPAFWREMAGYDRLERARGFLDGVAFTDAAASGGDPTTPDVD
jgi:predicted metal-dependent hydrolase